MRLIAHGGWGVGCRGGLDAGLQEPDLIDEAAARGDDMDLLGVGSAQEPDDLELGSAAALVMWRSKISRLEKFSLQTGALVQRWHSISNGLKDGRGAGWKRRRYRMGTDPVFDARPYARVRFEEETVRE
jgi:hypothetical protein